MYEYVCSAMAVQKDIIMANDVCRVLKYPYARGEDVFLSPDVHVYSNVAELA